MSAGNMSPGSHWLDQEHSENHKEKFRILVLTFVVVFFTSYEHHFDEWVYTQWVLNYDFGLVRRGLVGGLLKAFGYVPSPEFYMIAAFVFSLCVCIALFWLLSRSALSYCRQSTAAFLLALFFICHPLIVLHFAQASGFLDNINYLIAILGIVAILKGPAKVGALAVLLAGGLIIPIHEASFVMFIPLLIGIWFYTNRPKVVSFDSFLIFVVFALLLAKVIFIGTSNPGSKISLQEYYEHLLSTTQPIDIEAVGILFNTLHGNSSETASVMLSVLYLNFHLNMLLGLIPTFFIGTKILKALSSHIKLVSYESFLLACSVSPLALYLIASDYTRWWSIAISNTAISLTLLMRDPVLAAAITTVVNRYKWFIIFAIGFGLALGPFTSHLSYRNLNWLYSL
ncbi:hypothetical protein [Phytopseudomonas dryadis]|nr:MULTISPECIES: hypothetical protein [Pseudomonas]TBV12550.1 hypothetical protein DNK41_24440 [Pseudomonas sp. FRB 230]